MLQHQLPLFTRLRQQSLLDFQVAVVDRHRKVAQVDLGDVGAGAARAFGSDPDQPLVQGSLAALLAKATIFGTVAVMVSSFLLGERSGSSPALCIAAYCRCIVPMDALAQCLRILCDSAGRAACSRLAVD